MFARTSTIARFVVSAVAFAAVVSTAEAGQSGQWQFVKSGQGYAVAANSRYDAPVAFNQHGGKHNGNNGQQANGRDSRQLAKLERKEQKLQMKLAKLERREQRIRNGR